MEQKTALVTGASGFIALHLIQNLIERGYNVRGTVRSLSGREGLQKILNAFSQGRSPVELYAANLNSDEGWEEAIQGCDEVYHLASPFPKELPKHEDELIVPAKEGALRVLEASQKLGIKRVVLTSSIAAISYQELIPERSFDERDWSDLNWQGTAPYIKSKILAEKAAWEFAVKHPEFELVCVHPGAVTGPILNAVSGTSNELVRKVMAKELPGIPSLGYPCVDVRDVAEAHVLAMLMPQAKGQRYALVSEFMWMLDIAKILSTAFPDKNIATRFLPAFMVKLAATWDKTLKSVLADLGRRVDISNTKAIAELGWQPRRIKDSVIDTAKSLRDWDVIS